jgi:hypothetical protein
MTQAGQNPEISPSQAQRRAREAEALRANLARRKAQNRARQHHGDDHAGIPVRGADSASVEMDLSASACSDPGLSQ